MEIKAFDEVLYGTEKWIVGWVKGSIALIVNGEESRVVLVNMVRTVNEIEDHRGEISICNEQK